MALSSKRKIGGSRLRKPITKSKKMFTFVKGVGKADPFIRMLVYAEYGTGKTVLAATAVDVEEMNDVLFLNSDEGITAIDNKDDDGNNLVERKDNIYFVQIGDYKDFDGIYQFIKDHTLALNDNDIETVEQINIDSGFPEEFRLRTVIVDSISQIDNSNFNRLVGVDNSNLIDDPKQFDWQDYGRNKVSMTNVLTEFSKLKCNIIMTAPAEVKENKKTGDEETYPIMIGSSREIIKGFFHVVGYYEQLEEAVEVQSKISKSKARKEIVSGGKLTRRFWLRKKYSKGGVQYSKSRITPDGLKYIDNPTMQDFYNHKHKI